MSGRIRRWPAGPVAAVALTAACAGPGEAAPAAPAPSPVVWQKLGGCPRLADPPYGLPAQGEAVPGHRSRKAPSDEVRCVYRGAEPLPSAELIVTLERGPGGPAATAAEHATERAAAAQLGGADFADVAGIGDEAFAWYEQPIWRVFLRARSGNATMIVQVHAGPDVAQTWSVTAPLPEQLPTVTPLLEAAAGVLS